MGQTVGRTGDRSDCLVVGRTMVRRSNRHQKVGRAPEWFVRVSVSVRRSYGRTHERAGDRKNERSGERTEGRKVDRSNGRSVGQSHERTVRSTTEWANGRKESRALSDSRLSEDFLVKDQATPSKTVKTRITNEEDSLLRSYQRCAHVPVGKTSRHFVGSLIIYISVNILSQYWKAIYGFSKFSF